MLPVLRCCRYGRTVWVIHVRAELIWRPVGFDCMWLDGLDMNGWLIKPNRVSMSCCIVLSYKELTAVTAHFLL